MVKSKKEERDSNNVQEIVEKIIAESQDNQFSELLQSSSTASELFEVIAELMSSKGNLKLKTEILKPKSLAVLSIIEDFSKSKALYGASALLHSFQDYYLQNMVSYKRHSREEIVEILKNQKEELEKREEIVE